MTTFSAIICTRVSRSVVVLLQPHMVNQHMRLRWSHANNYLFTSRFRSPRTERWPEQKNNNQQTTTECLSSSSLNALEKKTKAKVHPFERMPCFSLPSIAPSVEMFLRHKYRKIVTSLCCWNLSATKFILSASEDFFLVRTNQFKWMS